MTQIIQNFFTYWQWS